MKSFAVLPVLGALISTTVALTPITIKGNAFFQGDKRFYVRGVAYQPGGAADAKDPLLDISGLERDIKNFKELGINTVRVYSIDNSENHDKGMKMLEDAGIYLALDANTPDFSLNRETPATLHRSYNDVYLQSVFATIDAFASYDNLLLLFSGNEVINMKNNTGAATYIKAVTRDMKQYIKAHKYRQIPVGYSAADVSENIEQQVRYFDCGDDSARGDFFAFNDYSWCDPSDFKKSGWDKKIEKYSNYSVPLFLSEFGCNTNTREWNEIGSLYSTDTSAVYSGGLAYEYTSEPNGFGLVKVENGKITPNDDFKSLKEAYAGQKDPSGDGGFKQSGKASDCPPAGDQWEVTASTIPAIPEPAEKYMTEKAGKGPGLDTKGVGSHFAGTASKTDENEGTNGSSESTQGDKDGNPDKGNAGVAVDAPLRLVGMIAATVVFGSALLF